MMVGQRPRETGERMLLPPQFLPFFCWHLSGECIIVDTHREQQAFLLMLSIAWKREWMLNNSADPF